MTSPTLHDLEQRELELWEAYHVSCKAAELDLQRWKLAYKQMVEARMRLDKLCTASS